MFMTEGYILKENIILLQGAYMKPRKYKFLPTQVDLNAGIPL